MKQYKGEISDFPFEVVEKMLDYQEQNREKNAAVFEKYLGAGFNWDETIEGWSFWQQIIRKKNFDLFFQKYPTKLIFEKNTAYQAETEEEAKMLLAEAHRQSYKSNNGYCHFYETCYCTEGYWNTKEYWVEEDYKIVTVKEFFNQTKTNMNIQDRFPFKLKEEQARKIIAAACSGANGWKTKLAEYWGSELLLHGSVEIREEFYKEMRKACTKEQHKLFDEIFGVDKVEIDFSILNNEDIFYIKYYDNIVYLSKGNPFGTIRRNLLGLRSQHKINDRLIESHLVEVRIATKEEQELYYKFYPKWSIKDAKDGEPVWVRNHSSSQWYLRYADGNGQIYHDQKKFGKTTKLWEIIMKFDPNNLPVND